VTSFAQGNFTFNNSSTSLVWENISTAGGPLVKAGPVLEVAVMWTTNLAAVPTTFPNGPTTYGGSWLGILTDPNFHLALDTAGGNPPIVSTCGGAPPFAGIYLGGIHYIFGSSAAQTIQLYVFGWDKSYGVDPVAAAVAFAPVGYSSPIQYTLGSTALPGGSLGNAGISGFAVVVPEPSSCALAGLGAAALLIFRRRRNH
jgi:hypothetical protein